MKIFFVHYFLKETKLITADGNLYIPSLCAVLSVRKVMTVDGFLSSLIVVSVIRYPKKLTYFNKKEEKKRKKAKLTSVSKPLKN